jgi:lipoyl(octanoyl) transferase
MTAVRLIVDPPQPGDWNMAVDEALLGAAEAGVSTLRFYQWSAPTLSLGYFQDYRERDTHPASSECTCVRRSSGGGAILHDHELTYSFTAPKASRGGSRFQSVYDLFHQSLIRALSHWNLKALQNPRNEIEGVTPPFLCFQRRARGDVLIGDQKICGSAQRRHRGALLQHGSVILRQSSFAPEIQGIEEIAGRSLSAGEVAEVWRHEICKLQSVAGTTAELSTREREQAREIRSRRFADPGWLYRR